MDTLILREKKVCKKFWQHSRLSWLFQLQWIVPFCKKNSSNSRNNVCFEIKNSILPDKTEKISNIYFLPCGLHVLLNLGTYDKKTITDWKKLLVVSISPQILQLLICFMEFSNSWPMKSLHDKTKFTKLYCFFFMSLIQHCILTWCWVLVPAHGPHYWLFTFSRLRFFFLKV